MVKRCSPLVNNILFHCCLFLRKKGSGPTESSMLKSPGTSSILVVVVIDVSWKFPPILFSINAVKGGYSHDSLQEVTHPLLPQSHQCPLLKINSFCKRVTL